MKLKEASDRFGRTAAICQRYLEMSKHARAPFSLPTNKHGLTNTQVGANVDNSATPEQLLGAHKATPWGSGAGRSTPSGSHVYAGSRQGIPRNLDAAKSIAHGSRRLGQFIGGAPNALSAEMSKAFGGKGPGLNHELEHAGQLNKGGIDKYAKTEKQGQLKAEWGKIDDATAHQGGATKNPLIEAANSRPVDPASVSGSGGYLGKARKALKSPQHATKEMASGIADIGREAGRATGKAIGPAAARGQYPRSIKDYGSQVLQNFNKGPLQLGQELVEGVYDTGKNLGEAAGGELKRRAPQMKDFGNQVLKGLGGFGGQQWGNIFSSPQRAGQR